jgi:hypothetical protein
MTNDIEQLTKIQPQEPFIMMGYSEDEEPVEVVLAAEKWMVGFPSNLVVVGHDGEYADMSNPTGAIVRERFYMVAEDALGHRRTWGGLYESEAAAEAIYSLLAPTVAVWEETRPCYGSEAWTPEVDAAEVEAERADELASNFLNFRYEC